MTTTLAQTQENKTSTQAKPTVLIIDDDKAVLETIGRLLGYEGYTVRTAQEGMAGVQLALDNPPDLVLCDVSMPQMDGYEVMKTLRSYCGLEAVPVVFLSGRAEAKELRAGMEQGGDDYLVKPIQPQALLGAVRARLQRAESLQHAVQHEVSAINKGILSRLPHELINPLNGVLGFAELIQKEKLSGNAREMAQGLQQSAAKLERVLKKYLFFVKLQLAQNNVRGIEEEFGEPTLQASEVIQRAALRTAIANNRHSDLQLSLQSVAVSLNETALERVVVELVENACLYSPAGTPIQVGLEKLGSVVRLAVCDRGPGMTPQEVRTIAPFVRYERAGGTGTLGVGLYIVSVLAKLMGGSFAVERMSGTITRVGLSLPLIML